MKTDLPQGLYRLCPGGRRSFFCRMKCKAPPQPKEGSDTTSDSHRRKKHLSTDKKYIVVQCTGYLKSWAPAKNRMEEQETDGDGESCNLSCLVAIGRIPKPFQLPSASVTSSKGPKMRVIQFHSRHAVDGKFLFLDHRYCIYLPPT